MRILVVEDDQSFLDDLVRKLERLPGSPELVITRSRDAAMHAIDSGFFDLVMLDLTIPTAEGGLDLAVAHGNAVFSHARTVARGTPIFILTGSTADDLFTSILEQSTQADIWGEAKARSTIDYLTKRQFDKADEKLEPIADAIRQLANIEVDRLGKTFDLSIQEKRIIRSFARARGGTRCNVQLLSGGLSGARVFHVKVFDAGGATRINAVAKIGTHVEIKDEAKRYGDEIARLDSKATPRVIETREYGARECAGIFYGLADGYDYSLFTLVLSQPALAAKAISTLVRLTENWRDKVPERQVSVGDVRRRLVSDSDFAKIVAAFDLGWTAEFEKRPVQVRWCCVHGDLHGANILVDGAGTPVLIDYGDVGSGASALDPVTIEFSMFFHPDGPLRGHAWPDEAQAKQWGDLTTYLTGSPAPDVVLACRDYAAAVYAGKRELAAAAYAYLVRQLKYDGTDKDRVLALLQGVRRLWDGT